jgi:hypothetical protein
MNCDQRGVLLRIELSRDVTTTPPTMNNVNLACSVRLSGVDGQSQSTVDWSDGRSKSTGGRSVYVLKSIQNNGQLTTVDVVTGKRLPRA